MAYREVRFHVHEEDFVAGLTVMFLNVAGRGLVPYTWVNPESGRDYRPSHFPNREGSATVDVEVYGGTREQFENGRDQHAAYCAVHGWQQDVYVHFPKADL